MTSAIWIDANVPMYAFGRDGPYRPACKRILGLAGDRPGAFWIDAEVLQEVLHRYLAVGVWAHQQPAFMRFALLMQDTTEPIYGEDVERAGAYAGQYRDLSARDLLHLAVMQRVGATHIVSADRGFDQIDGITRLDPLRVEEWEPLVAGG
jgi:hypothetical protein